MRVEGTLVKWDDERGFGFIRSADGGKDVFVHITAFPLATGRPDVGETVSYEIEESDRGPRAARVMSLRTIRATSDVPQLVPSGRTPSKLELLVIPIFIGVLGAICFKLVLARVALAGYAFTSLITYFLFMHDKLTARAGGWRVGEGTLLFWSFIGGWPGGLLAQHLLSHKTRKVSFRIAFWGVAFVNIALLCASLILLPDPWK